MSYASSEAPARGMLRGVQNAAKWWWVLLITGAIWIFLAFLVLRFNTTSIDTVGIILGIWFLFAAITQIGIFAMLDSGWRWLSLALGVLFAIGAIYAFVNPENAFWALAAVLGLLLFLMGITDVITSIMERDANDLWWLGLITGILELFLAFWVSYASDTAQQAVARRVMLILVWVGFFSLFRGIMDIVSAFRLRSLGHKAEAYEDRLDERVAASGV